jgi:hypothetical protein
LLQGQLARLALKAYRIVAGKTSHTEIPGGKTRGFQQPVHREIAQGIDFQESPDVLDG